MKDELDLDSMDQLRPEHINDNELKNFFLNYRTTLFTTTPSPRQRPSRSHTLIPLSYNGCPPSSWRWRKRNDSRICGENATHLTMNRFGIKTSGERSLTTGIRDGLSMARRTLPPTLMRRWETKGNEELGDHLLPLLKCSSLEFLKCSERRFILCLMCNCV